MFSKENSWKEREKALEEWRSEIEKTLTVMISAFSEELRNTYLTTVVEQVRIDYSNLLFKYN